MFDLLDNVSMVCLDALGSTLGLPPVRACSLFPTVSEAVYLAHCI